MARCTCPVTFVSNTCRRISCSPGEIHAQCTRCTTWPRSMHPEPIEHLVACSSATDAGSSRYRRTRSGGSRGNAVLPVFMCATIRTIRRPWSSVQTDGAAPFIGVEFAPLVEERPTLPRSTRSQSVEILQGLDRRSRARPMLVAGDDSARNPRLAKQSVIASPSQHHHENLDESPAFPGRTRLLQDPANASVTGKSIYAASYGAFWPGEAAAIDALLHHRCNASVRKRYCSGQHGLRH